VEDGGVSIASVENNAPVIYGSGALVSQACGSAHSTMLKVQKRPGILTAGLTPRPRREGVGRRRIALG